MKRIFIIHRWGGTPNSDWYQWVLNELQIKGYQVFIPIMPETDKPDINKWVSKLSEIIGTPDDDICLIGHSIGSQTIMRYLMTLSENTKINKIVFVAGWLKLDGLAEEGEEIINIARPWLETPINFNRVKNICPKIQVLLSSNEPFGYVEENKKIFEEKLNAKVTILKNKGHFTEDDSVKELSEILKFF